MMLRTSFFVRRIALGFARLFRADRFLSGVALRSKCIEALRTFRVATRVSHQCFVEIARRLLADARSRVRARVTRCCVHCLKKFCSTREVMTTLSELFVRSAYLSQLHTTS